MNSQYPIIKTRHLFITIVQEKHTSLIADYLINNKHHLKNWEPTRNESYYQLDEITKRAQQSEQDFNAQTSISFVAFNSDQNKIIAMCQYSNIVKGVFQACHLGYNIDATEQGKGLMFEMLQATNEYIFEQIGLHRIMANYMPENKRSEQLLKKLGFVKEGMAKSYLKINGQWEDHVLTSKINEL